MNDKSIWLSQRGSTILLIWILLSTILFGSIAYILQMYGMSPNTQLRLRAKYDLENYESVVMGALSTDYNCLQNLKKNNLLGYDLNGDLKGLEIGKAKFVPWVIKPGAVTGTPDVPDAVYKVHSDKSSPEVEWHSAVIEPLEFRALRVIDNVFGQKRSVLYELKSVARARSEGVTSLAVRSAKILAYVVADTDNKIVSCNLTTFMNEDETVQDYICASMQSAPPAPGKKFRFFPVAKKCEEI